MDNLMETILWIKLMETILWKNSMDNYGASESCITDLAVMQTRSSQYPPTEQPFSDLTK